MDNMQSKALFVAISILVCFLSPLYSFDFIMPGYINRELKSFSANFCGDEAPKRDLLFNEVKLHPKAWLWFKSSDHRSASFAGKVVELKIMSSSTAGDGDCKGISFDFESNEELFGYALLSLKPFPEQRWKVLSSNPFQGDGLHLASEVIQTKHGIFRVEMNDHTSDGKPIEEGEFLQSAIRITKQSTAKTWVPVVEFVDQYVIWTLDVDGDGVPELIGPTGYKDWSLRSFIPSLKMIAINPSGV